MRSSALKREQTLGEPFVVSRSYGTEERRERQLGKAMLAGLAGGLVGSFAMSQFQNRWSKAASALKKDSDTESQNQSGQQSDEQSEDATMKTAGKIAEITGHQLSHEQKAKLGPVVHYSFGTLQGGIYGAVTELAETRGGFVPGITFGAALFGLADELAVPALGLSGKPTESPLSSHLYALVSHLVYGISTDAVQRGIRALLQ
ncbi:MAG TPA: DUF1440 domain-containing protein [Candidatus Angelobacter sp.]|nr:DUF1440 domain-containing protein [Candidatus Angelobacter sp.]